MTTLKVADQKYDTSDRELFAFLSYDSLQLPSYVKEASIEEVKAEGLQKQAHADEINGMFPINSKAKVYVSNAFFLNKKAEFLKQKGLVYVEKIASRINTAAAAFGITEDLGVYKKAYDLEQRKEPKAFTITANLGDDKHYDLFNLSSAEDVVVKAAEFLMDLQKYPFVWKREIATQFVKAAEYFDLDELPDLLVKYAGQFYPDIAGASAEIDRRANRVKEASKAIYKQAKDALEGATDIEDFFKVAEILYSVETEEGLYKNAHYRKVLGDPVDKLFVHSAEKIARMLDVVEIHGKIYAMDDFTKTANNTFEEAFGFEKPASTDELRDILPTLPLSDFSLFRKLSGIKELT